MHGCEAAGRLTLAGSARAASFQLPRMQIYLPIAEVSVDVFMLLGMGAAVGFFSGLFGVGGGFLMTPLLIFAGIPATVAVGSEANQLVATSISGVLAHWRRNTLDLRMGAVLLAGGFVGSSLGVWLFRALSALGQIDVVISVSYVVFLGAIGSMMFIESIRALLRNRRGTGRRGKLHKQTWLHGLPLKLRFPRSRLYISALAPAALGFLVGVLAAIMGVGGGFIMVPAMIYLLGMPTAVVAGTSLFQILFVTANATFLQSVYNQTVDVILALLLLAGSVIGVQIGTRLGGKLPAEQFRFLLAAMVLAVCLRLFVDLITPPADPFSLQLEATH